MISNSSLSSEVRFKNACRALRHGLITEQEFKEVSMQIIAEELMDFQNGYKLRTLLTSLPKCDIMSSSKKERN